MSYVPQLSTEKEKRKPRPDIPRGWLKHYFKLQKGRCYYCRRKMYLGRRGRMRLDDPSRQASFDHMFPLSREGAHALENGCAACKLCNNLKKSKTPAEFKIWLKDQVELYKDGNIKRSYRGFLSSES